MYERTGCLNVAYFCFIKVCVPNFISPLPQLIKKMEFTRDRVSLTSGSEERKILRKCLSLSALKSVSLLSPLSLFPAVVGGMQIGRAHV